MTETHIWDVLQMFITGFASLALLWVRSEIKHVRELLSERLNGFHERLEAIEANQRKRLRHDNRND